MWSSDITLYFVVLGSTVFFKSYFTANFGQGYSIPKFLSKVSQFFLLCCDPWPLEVLFKPPVNMIYAPLVKILKRVQLS